VGLKFQASDESAALYGQAQALAGDKSRWSEVGERLGTIGSINGRLEDISRRLHAVGELYKQAWLRDNRPYWLQNNLTHYDVAAQLWVWPGEHWNLVQHQWWDTHTLRRRPRPDCRSPRRIQSRLISNKSLRSKAIRYGTYSRSK